MTLGLSFAFLKSETMGLTVKNQRAYWLWIFNDYILAPNPESYGVYSNRNISTYYQESVVYYTVTLAVP